MKKNSYKLSTPEDSEAFDLDDFLRYYRDNENAMLRILVNGHRQAAEKDAKIWGLEKKLQKYEAEKTEDLTKGKDSKKRFSKNKILPKITIGIASYNHSQFLEQCISSALAQDYENFEVVIVDDNSSDKKNRQIIEKFSNDSRLRAFYKNKNEGISASLNDQIINSQGEWVAFLDCDDYLPPNALTEMVKFARDNRTKKLIFSSRNEVNEKNEFIRVVDFGTRDQNPDIFDELMKGMASSHLKMIHKDVFRTVGLFDTKYDGIQDYDMYLRAATYMPHAIAHVDKTLYFHRIHDSQNTTVDEKKHERNLKLLKEATLNRKKILESGCEDKISVIILSFNRGNQTQKCVETILQTSTDLNLEIIIWDNGSDDKDTLKILKSLSRHKLVTVHYSKVNLRCSGGRKAAAKLAQGKYLLFLDNDIEVKPTTIKELLISVTENKKTAAACCRLVFPNKTVQFNGATYKKDKQLIEFELINNGRGEEDLATLVKRRDCRWLPGGATLVRKEDFDNYEFDEKFINAFEDNDFYMRMKNDGHILVNSPLATAVHHHIEFADSLEKGGVSYAQVRKSYESQVKSWFHFYKKWGLIIKDAGIFYLLGINFVLESARIGDDFDKKTLVKQFQNEKEILAGQIHEMMNSSSWKITRPLRDANHVAKVIVKRLKRTT